MAWYKPHPRWEQVLLEQNITDNGELASYAATYETDNGTKTTALMYYEEGDKRWYSLNFLENEPARMTVVTSDLSAVFAYRTPQVRRKHLMRLIEKEEARLKKKKTGAPQEQTEKTNPIL